MVTVNLIATVGTYGQIGLDGKTPWLADPDFAKYVADADKKFMELTKGGLIIVGPEAYEHIPKSRVDASRIYLVWDKAVYGTPATMLANETLTRPDRDVWIAGGQEVFELFTPFCDWHYISQVPYQGPADKYLPTILPAWGYVARNEHGSINHILPVDSLPDEFMLLQRHGFPVWFGPIPMVPPHEFETQGTTAFVSHLTHKRITEAAARSAEFRTIQ